MKRRQPDRVVLLAGNRDINKMRLRRELGGHPPSKAPAGLEPPQLLRWILANTMGAARAFEHRATELRAVSEQDVVDSFCFDVSPPGPIAEYLAQCQLVFRSRETLFVHGALTDESVGVVPGIGGRIPDLDEWVGELNAFYSRQVAAFCQDSAESEYSGVIAYQRSVPGTRMNQASVVYGRFTDDSGNPSLPHSTVIASLVRAGVRRLTVGHTPSGDTPSVLRDPERGFELIMADNSYGRLEVGTQLFVDGTRVAGRSSAELDGGARVEVQFELDLDRDTGPLGLRDSSTGHLVKGRINGDGWLLFRGLGDYKIEQTVEPTRDVSRRTLIAPRR